MPQFTFDQTRNAMQTLYPDIPDAVTQPQFTFDKSTAKKSSAPKFTFEKPKPSLLEAGAKGAYAPFKPLVDRAIQPAIDLFKEGQARQPTMPLKGESGGQFALRAARRDIPEGMAQIPKVVGAAVAPLMAPTATIGQETEKLAVREFGVPDEQSIAANRDKDYSFLDTKLSPEREKEFQRWKAIYAPKDSGFDYDLRGAFLKGYKPSAENGHFPDEFKKPNHPTFSNQSKFAKDYPQFAGSWGEDNKTYIPHPTVEKLGKDTGDVAGFILAGPEPAGAKAIRLEKAGGVTPGVKSAEKIDSAAIKKGKQVYVGKSHDAIRKANETLKGGQEGFVTNIGEFVPRKKAMATAKAAGQLAQKPIDKTKLHSEDIGQPSPKQRTISSFRSQEGRANRKIVQFENQLDQHYNTAYELVKTPVENLAVHDYMQGREGAEMPPLKNLELQKMADDVRGVMKGMQKEIEAMDEGQRISFYRDYFPNFFKNPEKARSFTSQWVARQGSVGNTLKRKYPTLRDGLEAGLEMDEPNIVKAASRYINRTAKFVGSQRIRQQMIKNGDAKWGGSAPVEGWEPLVGQSRERSWVEGEKAQGFSEKLWAPPDAAKIYNNAYSPGFEGTTLKHPYEALRSITVANTAAELSLSLFHPQVLWGQSLFNDLARLGKNMALFDFKGAGAAAKSLVAGRLPFMKGGNYNVGLRLMKQYKSLEDLGLDPRGILEHFEGGGGRVSQDPLYRGGAGTSAPALIRRTIKNPKEALHTGKNMLHEAVEARKKMFSEGNKLTETGKLGLDLLHNATEGAAYPLFIHYTPAIKMGAFEGMMGDWLRRNPGSSDEAIQAAREHYLDLVDERFGEMNMNNVFNSKYIKQMESLAFRAPGWLRGLARIHNYAYRDAYRIIKDSAKGKFDEKNLDRPLFLLSAIGAGMLINGTYQYLKTGNMPEGLDWFSPRTGGKTAVAKGTRFARQEDERTTLPLTAHFKELVRMYEPAWQTVKAYSEGKPLPVDSPLSGAADEIKNKLATFPRTGVELLNNSNYRGDPIYDTTGKYGAIGGMGQAAGHVAAGFEPFNFTDQHAEQPGSKLTGVERRGMGLYPAGMQIRNPEGYAKMRRSIEQKREKKAKKHEQRNKPKQQDAPVFTFDRSSEPLKLTITPEDKK